MFAVIGDISHQLDKIEHFDYKITTDSHQYVTNKIDNIKASDFKLQKNKTSAKFISMVCPVSDELGKYKHRELFDFLKVVAGVKSSPDTLESTEF